MGFPTNWRNWLPFGISIVHFSVLLSGEASSFFSSSRGLRQGDSVTVVHFHYGNVEQIDE